MTIEFPSEPTILDARKAFPDAQVALNGGTIERLPGPNRTSPWTCGWYGARISGERGSFALVQKNGALDPLLIGDRIRVNYKTRSVVVYVVSSETLEHDIHLSRRAFAALALLATESLDVSLEVLAGVASAPAPTIAPDESGTLPFTLPLELES